MHRTANDANGTNDSPKSGTIELIKTKPMTQLLAALDGDEIKFALVVNELVKSLSMGTLIDIEKRLFPSTQKREGEA